MLGTNLEAVLNKSSLIDRMKRVSGDLTNFVRAEFRGPEDSNVHDWLARAWKAYTTYSMIGERRFGALSFSWIALNSVLKALQELDGALFPALPTEITTSTIVLEQTPSHEEGVDEAPPDYVNWNHWEFVPEPGAYFVRVLALLHLLTTALCPGPPRGAHHHSSSGHGQHRRSSGSRGGGQRGYNGHGGRPGSQNSSRNFNRLRQTSGSNPRSPASENTPGSPTGGSAPRSPTNGGSSRGRGGNGGSGRGRGYSRV